MKKYITVILLYFTINSYAQKVTSNIKPFDEVITSEAITKKSFLSVHRLNNKLYLEIPSAMLNTEMLFVEYSDFYGARQVKWIKRDDKIHLIIPEIESKVGNIIPVIFKKFNVKITPATFPILATGKNNSSYVIDATALFLNTPKPLSGHGLVIHNNLAFINKVLVFDDLIDVKTEKTSMSKNGPLTIDVDFSLLLLPEAMKPRLHDYRMGYFGDFGGGYQKVSVARWRLEKKDKNLELSEPIKPITLYFSPETPNKWKPYLRAGIEDWLQAFEAAGFKNAIVVKDPPLDDKNWSINSMKYSYIRWIDKNNYRGYDNAGSGSVSFITDKRTGEILKADIRLGAPYQYLSDEYFIRCSPLDPRAQEYPFPDDLMGELIQRVTSHEAGHFFGLMDGDYGEFTYPFEKMRDKEWLQEMGHTPSVMNYTRQNYIVQPEDSIPVHLLRQKVGPTDIYSIRWAYTQFKNINTPDDELSYLEKIIREQDSIPWYRYRGIGGAKEIGPDGTDEVVDSDNPIKGTALALKNLKRVIKLIPKATQKERGNETLKRLYTKTLNQWVEQMKSVVSLVGGFTTHYKNGNQEGVMYDFTKVPVTQQKEAIALLIKEALHTPLWMKSPNITRRFEENGTFNNISTKQLIILTDILSFFRLKNMEEIDLTIDNSYKISDLFNDLNKGLWHELEDKTIKVDPYRQAIQLSYIVILKKSIEMEGNEYGGDGYPYPYRFSPYIRGYMASTLTNIKRSIEKSIDNISDTSTRAHLELCLLEINKNKS